MKLLYSLLVWLISFSLFYPSKILSQKDKFDTLDAYLQKTIKDFDLPGMAIGIVKDGEVVFEKGYGVRNVKTNIKVTPKTTFAIASLTKAFTATCIGILVQRGELQWTDKVTKYLPWFRLHDPCVTAQFTVSDLLTHRSGLKTFDGDLLWYNSDHSREEVVKRIRHLPLSQNFRSDFGYQNVMFIAAGELIEEVTGKSWDQFIRQGLLKPLEMDQTVTSITKLSAEHELAIPHLEKKPIPLQNFDNVGPAGSLNSSVENMTHWIKMWLNYGIRQQDTLLSPKMTSTLLSPQNLLPVRANDRQKGIHFKAYGYGWFLMDYAGKKIAYHRGGLPGYISNITLVPEENMGFIILTNDRNWLPSALMYRLLDVFLKERSQWVDWPQKYLKIYKNYQERKEARKKARNDQKLQESGIQLPDSAITGTYKDHMYGKAKVFSSKKGLILSLLPSQKLFTSTLEHWHYNTYKIKFKDPFLPRGFVTFHLNSDGQVKDFKIDLPNPDFHFSNLLFKKIRP